jgi:iron complex outermembrane receptor protein
MNKFCFAAYFAAALLCAAPLNAQQVSTGTDGGLLSLPAISITAVAPLPGTAINKDTAPSDIQTVQTRDLYSGNGGSKVLSSVAEKLNGVNINSAMGDDFQPDILYRGFEASPVLGTPQGLAVYQNGVRINEAFGDTVNWDLFPDFAVDRIDLLGSNPVYGRNALGGAIGVTMKNGFTWQGLQAEVSGGSYGQRSGSVEYGGGHDGRSAYIAAKMLDEDGWRAFSSDSLRQLYADFGLRGEQGETHLSVTAANNRMDGQGSAPIEWVEASRSSVFTGPQEVQNQLVFLNLSGDWRFNDAMSARGNAYMRDFVQHVENGNTTNYEACTNSSGLCQSDGTTPVYGSNGLQLPDITDGGTVAVGENDMEYTHSTTWGASAQVNGDAPIFGLKNTYTAGASAERAKTDFGSEVEVGALDSDLFVESGYFVDTGEDSAFTATPVSLSAINYNYGAFASDTLNPTDELAVTASGRFNVTEIYLTDGNGTALDGANRYARVNPALGATYRINDALSAYAGYAEGNRTPTPSEIECSDPAKPCLLPSSLASDPPTLKQVVSHTYESGLRGSLELPRLAPGKFTWSAGVYRTDLDDDIYGVATSQSSGYFENIGSTRRQGVETRVDYKDAALRAYAAYTLVDATFQSAMTMYSPNNPSADSNGDIYVASGDKMPGIPQNQFKFGADWRVTPSLSAGFTTVCMGPQYYRGDEANLNGQLPGYQVVNVHASYELTKRVTAFAGIDNIFNAHYYTFGEYGDPDVSSSSVSTDNRFVSPSAPVEFSGGLRVKF